MKVYLEAIEQDSEEPDFIKVELPSQASEQATIALLNAQMKGGKQYKKRVHYCRQVTDFPGDNLPCVVEEFTNNPTFNKRPTKG